MTRTLAEHIQLEKDISNAMLKLRYASRMTQLDFAATTGLTYATYKNVEIYQIVKGKTLQKCLNFLEKKGVKL